MLKALWLAGCRLCNWLSYCNKLSDSHQINNEDALKNKLSVAASEKTKFNVIVPFSGGKDSTYALFLMKEIYQMRPLAINFDNGFRSEYAIKNLHHITNLLEVDLVTIKPDWGLMRKLYKCFLKYTGKFCTVCNAIGYLTIFNYVLQLGHLIGCSPLVVGAWVSKIEEQPDVYSFDMKYFINTIKEENNLYEELINNCFIDEDLLCALMNNPDPRVVTSYDESLIVNFIQLPDYLNWDIKKR
ncbi:hypothetical protein ABDB91_18285 [Desulfoscipio sp. XC116]|uniref:hypothetical protein n=1 Tax=Desulfoscipio sp. XC116 TaxID=3144975 RepID=UPI00325A6593